MKPALAVFGVAACAGCAWEPGHGFATLSEASVVARLELEGPLLSDSGDEISLQALEIDVSAVTLEASAHAESAEPEHMHEHEEAQADEVGAGLEPVAVLRVDQALDWIAAAPVEVTAVEPSRELPQTELSRATVSLTFVRLSCAFADAELGVELPLELELAGAMDFDVDRDAPERLAVHVSILQSTSLFRGLDLAGLPPGSTTLLDPADPLAGALLENLAESQVAVAVREAP